MPVPATPSRFQRYVAVLSRWLFVFGMVFVLAKLAGDYVTTHWLPQYYRAKVEMEVKPREAIQTLVPQDQNAPVFEVSGPTPISSTIQSSNMLLPIIQDLGLKDAWAKRVFKKEKEESLSDEEAVAYLKNSLRLEVVRGTNIIKITVTDDDAKEAADIANAIADRYKKMRDVEETQLENRGLDALKEQIATQQNVVDEKRAALEKIREVLGSNDSGPTPEDETQRRDLENNLDKFKDELLSAQEDYDARQVLLEKVINLPDDQFISVLKGIGRDPNIAFDPTKPSQNKDKVAALRRAMQIDTYMAKSRVYLLQKQVDAQTEMIRHETTQESVPFFEAQRQLKQQQSLLDALNVRLKQDQADIALQHPVRIISRAEVPMKPDHRIAPTLTLVGAGILALIAASFVEMILLFQRAAERHSNE